MNQTARKLATYEDLFDLPENIVGEIINGLKPCRIGFAKYCHPPPLAMTARRKCRCMPPWV